MNYHSLDQAINDSTVLIKKNLEKNVFQIFDFCSSKMDDLKSISKYVVKKIQNNMPQTLEEHLTLIHREILVGVVGSFLFYGGLYAKDAKTCSLYPQPFANECKTSEYDKNMLNLLNTDSILLGLYGVLAVGSSFASSKKKK